MNPLETFVSSMTLAELSSKTGTSVADIVAFAAKGAPAPKAKSQVASAPKAAAPKAAKPTKASGNEVNTRTPEGRAAYDAAVLTWLRENTSKTTPRPSSDLMKACGGTTLQARTTLNRLIEAGKASFVGKARSTKYWAS